MHFRHFSALQKKSQDSRAYIRKKIKKSLFNLARNSKTIWREMAVFGGSGGSLQFL